VYWPRRGSFITPNINMIFKSWQEGEEYSRIYIMMLASWLRRYDQDKNKFWKELLDYKCNTSKGNIFQTNIIGVSPFFKGFMWAAQAARMGYKWVTGNGEKVRFWEDYWLGTSSLAIQYWKLYRFVNESNKSVANLWDPFSVCHEISKYNMSSVFISDSCI